ncbi:putative uncharacterized protein DDB_G0282129 [Haplochromis burtoni]|uniref:putative uncharacterized protein DDB_G0282129 n=1 Tax=Haplochromis burtoni TaxID=8153 RepID=UPI001C2D8F8C|nr:putative uncharacterized protein DDB_G0282129 [Haplochromis burtoni]
MMGQGDRGHAQPNEEQPHETAEDGDGVERYNFIESPVYLFIAIIPRSAARPLQLHNNNNDDHIDLEFFFNVHFEIDDNNADAENDHNNSDIEHDHNYGDNQNADSSNNEEERNEGHQDENALAAAELTMKPTRMQEKQRRICFLEDLGDGLERKTVKM